MGLFHASLGAVAGSVLLPYLVPFEIYGAFAVLALVLVVVTRGGLSYNPSPYLLLTPVEGIA